MSTSAGSSRMFAFSEARNTLTDSTPGSSAMACWTCIVHSAQSIPATGTSMILVSGTLRLLRSVARTFVDAFSDIGQQFVGEAQKTSHAVVAQLVVHETAVLFLGHEATVSQTGEMIGGVRLREAGSFDNLAYGERPIAQGFEDGEARGIGESTEKFGLEIHGLDFRFEHHHTALISAYQHT